MLSNDGFVSDWASPPGETIEDLLEERKISRAALCDAVEIPQAIFSEFRLGRLEVTPEIASKLQAFFSVPSSFWLNRELQYRQALLRLNDETNRTDEAHWMSSLPLRDMVSFGWLERSRSKTEQMAACLAFFGVGNLSEWQAQSLNRVSTRFKSSATFMPDELAVAAWLRKGVIEAEKIEAERWNRQAFQISLDEMRQLSREKSPEIFLPKLQRLCAANGVALVVARSPAGCRASGATFFLGAHKAVILLSFRYLSDDHFWFTFFHEAGHLVLHGEQRTFLEVAHAEMTNEELEANEYAAKKLVPEYFLNEMTQLNLKEPSAVLRFAKRIGISPGIVVGQLQYQGIVSHSQFNRYKTRYVWSVSGDTN